MRLEKPRPTLTVHGSGCTVCVAASSASTGTAAGPEVWEILSKGIAQTTLYGLQTPQLVLQKQFGLFKNLWLFPL